MVVVQLRADVSAQERTVISNAVSPLLQYQGRLTDPDSGQPVADGSYTMTLRLYSGPSGGSPLWTETKDVPVQGGLFSTVLGDTSSLDHALFDGQALWLGIKVGADAEATPRQQVLPVAYALGMVPGATVQDLVVDSDLTVNGSLNGGAHNHPDLITQYEMDDHIYGGLHSNRALAFGIIKEDGRVASATGNVNSRWHGGWKCYLITIDGHEYDHWSYVTVVTPVIRGLASVSGIDGELCVTLLDLDGSVFKQPFHFVTFQP